MIENYRSDSAITDLANQFSTLLPNRMKQTPIHSVSHDTGSVSLHIHQPESIILQTTQSLHPEGTTAILTLTNEQALQAAYQLNCQGLHSRLIQSMRGFAFSNLLIVRYFLQCLAADTGSIISNKLWEQAKQWTIDTFQDSSCIDVLKQFFADFEATHRTYYRSDLAEYLAESKIEDFTASDDNTVFVSTIHKAKGREFDTVHLLLSDTDDFDSDRLRTLYVGITRAKHNLVIHTNCTLFNTFVKPIIHPPADHYTPRISLPLYHRDVFLNYFKDKQDLILSVRDGSPLRYFNGYLLTPQGNYVACLSNAMRQHIAKLQENGYSVTEAEATFTIAWKPQEEPNTYAIILPTLILDKESPLTQ